MPWDRGAWERVTRGEGNDYPDYSPPIYSTEKPKDVSNKKKEHLKKILTKFLSQNWTISQKKKDQYLNNNYYNAPYRLDSYTDISQKISSLISGKSNKSKFLVVSNNDLILDEILLEFSIKDNYRIFKSYKSANQLENLVNNVEEFEKVNQILFNNYAIKIFDDVESIENIQDLKILSENLFYIDNNSAKLLNDFLKSYWKLYEISNFSSIDLSLAERDVASEVSDVSNELNSVKNYTNRLNKILESLDFKIDNLNDFDIEVIKDNPALINKDDEYNFIDVLKRYHKINSYGDSLQGFINEFASNNFILGIITNFKRYADGRKDYEEINQEILALKNQFISRGLFFSKLDEYYEIKDKLIRYENVSFIEDGDYLILNEKIEEFLKFNVSFEDYFERCKRNFLFKMDSSFLYSNVNDAIKGILDICDTLGVKIESLSDLDNHAKHFKILSDYVKFNKKSTVANEQTIREYALNLYDELKDICNNLIQGSIEVDETELDYIIYNISTLKRVMDKIGLNISSLTELNDSFPIIADLEKDTSNDIFTSQTRDFLQNDKSEIYRDLDTLKDSMNYLSEQLDNNPDFMDIPIDNLSQSFNNQFKVGFLISNIESFIDSTNTYEEVLENYNGIIQNATNLMEVNNNFEFKENLAKIHNQLNSISKMHASQSYSTNQLMIDNISNYKSSINNDFNRLVQNGVFSKDKIDNCDVDANLAELNDNIGVIRDFINANGLYDSNFYEILKDNNEIILENEELKKNLDKTNIYNFYELSKQLDEENTDYDLVKEILDLSSKLNIEEYGEFPNFTLKDLISFSDVLERNIEFSEYVNKGIIDKEFNASPDLFNDLDLKIESINTKLTDLNLDYSIFDDFSQINVDDIDEIKEKLTKIDEYINVDSSNVDELVENYKLALDMLLNLCNDYNIEFNINNHKFNSSNFKLNLEGIQIDFDNYMKLAEIEKEMESYDDLIKNNLSGIWEGPLTDMALIEDKFKIDERFTHQYNLGIYTQKSLDNLSEISQSDLEFLNELKTMDDQKLKSKYILSYKYRDILLPEINQLNNLKNKDLNSYLEIFSNINKIYESYKLVDCMALLEYNIKNEEALRLIKEYENNLKSYSIIFYKFFNRRKFDMPIEDVISILENHFKFTELIDSQTINENYLESIKSDFDNFLMQVDLLVDLKTEILKDCRGYFGDMNVTFKEIRESWNDVDDANLVLMNLDTLRNSFNSNYDSYFDFVYIVDDNNFTDEDKLHLFLISKNKISDLKLMDG